MQLRPGDVALDQVILRPGPDGLLTEVLVGQAGQDDDGGVRLLPQQLLQAVEAARVGQAQVEQHAGRAAEQLRRLGEQPGPLYLGPDARLAEQFLDQQGITVVVLDEQDPGLVCVSCHKHLLEGVPAKGFAA